MTCASHTFLGCDISLNHGACVAITSESTSESTRCWYFTDKKTQAARYPNGYLVKRASKDPDILSTDRIAQIKLILEDIINKAIPDYAGVEGYAYSMRNQAHQLGEVGGLLRSILWQRRIPFRVYDPKTVKKFATSNGNADKKSMIANTQAKWNFPDTNLKVSNDTLGDLADACALAHMAASTPSPHERPWVLNPMSLVST